MDYIYIAAPFCAWFIAGVIKFLINTVKAKSFAIDQIGYGGMPSNHSAIVSSCAAIIAFNEGISHPAFGVAITLAFIVMLDANSLRRQIGLQAGAINSINKDKDRHQLRETIGHSRLEVCGGIVVGVGTAYLLDFFVNTISFSS
jgi:acid phosphatase family membrane protein YuiD